MRSWTNDIASVLIGHACGPAGRRHRTPRVTAATPEPWTSFVEGRDHQRGVSRPCRQVVRVCTRAVRLRTQVVRPCTSACEEVIPAFPVRELRTPLFSRAQDEPSRTRAEPSCWHVATARAHDDPARAHVEPPGLRSCLRTYACRPFRRVSGPRTSGVYCLQTRCTWRSTSIRLRLAQRRMVNGLSVPPGRTRNSQRR
jgi:hypothetical protein